MGELIDSSVLIGLERRGVTPASLARLLAGGEYTLAAITASELLVGVYRAEPPERGLRRSAFVEAALSRIPVLPFDLRVARTHAGLLADLLARGEMRGEFLVGAAESSQVDDLSDTGRPRGQAEILRGHAGAIPARRPSWSE